MVKAHWLTAGVWACIRGNSHDSHQVQWALPLAALFDVRVMVGNLFQTLCYRSVIICTLFLSCNSPNSMDQW